MVKAGKYKYKSEGFVMMQVATTDPYLWIVGSMTNVVRDSK